MFSKYSPLEQFEIYYVLWLTNCPVNLYTNQFGQDFLYWFSFVTTISNLLLTCLVLSFIVIFFLHVVFYNYLLVPRNWQISVNSYFTTLKNIISDLVSHPLAKRYYFVFFIFVFLVINLINIFGLIPYTFVLTSQFFFTFGLAFIFFITLNLTGIILHGFSFLGLFYPQGTPIFIVPLLVLIEFVSYIARVFSLAIRLFANITAGHILVKILSWLTWMVLDIVLISSVSFILISALWVLEFFISILQAYVFLTLLCLYLNDVLQLH